MSQPKPPKPWRRTDPRRTVAEFNNPVELDGACLRSSNAITRLRRTNESAAEALELLRETVGRQCPYHGRLEDPIIGVLGDEISFACPECSGGEIRARWAAEPIET